MQARNDGISDSVEDEGSSDLLLQKFIQDKNMIGLRGMTEFKDFLSTNVSKRLDDIESLMMALMKRSTGSEVPTKPTVAVEIGSGGLHTKQYRTPEEYLKSLSLPRTGNSFNGKTVEQIVAEIPSSLVVAIEIVNHLDMELTDYRQYLYDSYQHRRAPSTVYFQTREVFAFWRWLFHLPKGVVLKRQCDLHHNIALPDPTIINNLRNIQESLNHET
ncbi:unnamed protein product [Allacma fusca]|uniref:Uncharacterized protein n=1 Tax=Allacma fusca TaxID=39272 RepID=A0A8J2K938_9HEXA|nr:unnamed protein product [Allacma fusca]